VARETLVNRITKTSASGNLSKYRAIARPDFGLMAFPILDFVGREILRR
jgi:hypothetical protein